MSTAWNGQPYPLQLMWNTNSFPHSANHINDLWRCCCRSLNSLKGNNRAAARRRRKQGRHKFAYLKIKNSSLARFTRAFYIFGHFADVLVLSATSNDLFCSGVDEVSIWWQMFNLRISEALVLIDLFRLNILFSQYKSCDNTQEDWFFVLLIKKSACKHEYVCMHSF